MQYTTEELSAILSKHSKWLNDKKGGERADLHDANLWGANLDFSCLPLWCGGSKFKADAKIVRQILAHVSTIEVSDADDDLKAVLAAILPEAKKSHRAGDLGLL